MKTININNVINTLTPKHYKQANKYTVLLPHSKILVANKKEAERLRVEYNRILNEAMYELMELYGEAFKLLRIHYILYDQDLNIEQHEIFKLLVLVFSRGNSPNAWLFIPRHMGTICNLLTEPVSKALATKKARKNISDLKNCKLLLNRIAALKARVSLPSLESSEG